jgi:hypothetical protein
MHFTYRIGFWAVAALGVVALSGCQNAGGGQDFISDDPYAGGYDDYGDEYGTSGATTAGDSGDPAGEGEDGGDDGEDNGDGDVDISEADIVQVEGDRLYALSSYSGLTVVDMTNPDDLQALGTWETDAEPFEMYVDGGQAFVMFNDYGFWAYDESLDDWSYNTSSRLVALDAGDPQNIQVDGEFTLPGRIQDSRRVGDVLYVVTMQDGYCWDCSAEQQTVVTSLDISNPAQPAIVDQLEFISEGDNWDWQRSVASTTERMYVAARTWDWQGLGSYIDVIDISAGDGSLVAGAQVPVTGSVFSRWQMDEHEGTLRVISQLGWGENPLIETFTIESSQSIVPLGSGSLSLPVPESLRSVRFDGVRAYAITAEETDPLFTIDLSDPALPHQKGELEIPGWVYHMETRGDRVLALGFDPNHPDGSINVSLFDVSVFDQPALRRRVHFGGDWASFAEDQNRIHKAFSILDDEQMILVPHTGWEYDENQYECNGTYHSGVQIIDWLDDDLTLRGMVPARGQARRAFTHRERIVTLSDVELATFDYADRDAPAARDDLSIAVNISNLVRADNVWVRMGSDWYTGTQVLEIVSADDPGSPEPLGTIELGSSDNCEYVYVEGMFAVGDHVFVVQDASGWDAANDYVTSTRVLSIDISVPSAPVLEHTLELPGVRSWGTGSLGGVSTQSSWMVQQGDHLVFLMDDKDQFSDTQVVVVDLSNPAALEISATLERPAGELQGELSVMSDTVVSWHTEPVVNQPGKVRFYFDRLDLSGEPSWAGKVNVPGIIVAWDAQAGRAYTVDFQVHEVNLDANDCYNHPKYWQFEYDNINNDDSGTCKLIDQSLEQLAVQGAAAMLMRSIDIEGDSGLEQLYATDSRIFAKTDKSLWANDSYSNDSKLVVLDLDDANAEPVEIDGEQLGQWWSIVSVVGDRAISQSGYGQLSLIDASDVEQTEIQESSVPGWGGCYQPVIEGDTVYCPMGPYGLETVGW